MEEINWNDFEKVELRAGTILEVLHFPEARKPAYKIKADFGEFGVKWSSAQLTRHYAARRADRKTNCGCYQLSEKANW